MRLGDYRTSLRRWLSNPSSPALVFCENSGHDLSALAQISAEHNPHHIPVEMLSFDGNTYPRNLGKGLGELLIIEHALNQSKLIANTSTIIKVTGRLYVANISRLSRKLLRRPRSEVFCDLRANLAWADSRVFCATPRFLKTFLLPQVRLLDESRGIAMEQLLARASHHCMAAGLPWSLLPCFPDIRGVSGTSNVAYPHSILARAKRWVFHRLKEFSLQRGTEIGGTGAQPGTR